MIKFINVDQGIVTISRLMLTSDGLDANQVDTYMTTHQTPLVAAGRAAIEGQTDLQALSLLRTAIRDYIDANLA